MRKAGIIAAMIVAAVPAPAMAHASRFMVFFDWSKPELRSDDAATLDEVAKAYRQLPGVRLQLSGHTDRSGSAVTNRRAGLRRAETVRAELAKRGVLASAMTVVTYGEERPLVPTEDGVREVQNRRVEIELTGGASPAAAGTLVDGTGRAIGTVAIAADPGHATLNLSVTGLAAGEHGVHLHEAGRCDGPDFKSAGAHWNPNGRQHGLANPEGAHLGDLHNLTVNAAGAANATLHVAGDMGDSDGTSLVIHARPDDYQTDPSGNSGERIACAMLVAARP